ncbi:MAG: hemolysin family protein [Bacteroidales bacterium]|nr:hemolysin family protein [Bacteroidales bacterium]
MDIFTVTIIFIALIFSALFSGTEMAFVSAHKLRIELDKKKGLLSGKILARFLKRPSFFIASVLVGNNIALVIYGIYMSLLLNPVLVRVIPETYNNSTVLLISQTIISTLIILFLAEFLPKNLFRINPNSILNFFSVLIYIIYILLYPLTFIIIRISNFFIVYVFRFKLDDQRYVFSPSEIDMYLKEFSEQQNKEDDALINEMQIFQNARELPNIKVRECMIPRPEIIAVDENTHVSDLKNEFVEQGLSKIVIYSGGIDNIIGYIHVFDMFKSPKKIKPIIRPILIVPESMTADILLKTFIDENKSIAVVVDEFGGTSGIITIEDVVEEIFGEINDEYDVQEFEEKKISDNEYVFSGRIEIDYINDKYKLDIPVSDEYETLAGFIINKYESIPQKNEQIYIDNFLFVISEVSETKIEQVVMKIIN